MNIYQTIGTLALTGALVSAISQWLKQTIYSRKSKALMVFVLSAIGGIGLWSLQFVPANIWTIILGVYAAANTVYLAIVQWIEKPNSSLPIVQPSTPPAYPPFLPPQAESTPVDTGSGVAITPPDAG